MLLLHTAEKVLQTHTQYAKTHKGQLNIHIHAPRDVDFLYVEYENKSAYEIVKHIYMVDTLEQIVKDIEQFEELDHERYQNRFSGFYTAVKVVINMCKRNIQADTASSLHTSIVTEVKDMLVQKSTQELDTLENEIRERLQSGQGVVDVVYWETLLDEIVYQRALKFLQTTHEDIRNQLDTVIYELEREGVLTSEMRLQKQNELEEYMRIHHPTQPTHLSLDDVVVQQYLQEHAEMEMQEEEDAAKRQTEVHMGAKDEVPILPVHPTTHAQPMDKYHPRKPRYFNRVRTGWDRTKYNLSHYDYDNPPPKVIQGYKFTIFYPDLIDKTITPRYACVYVFMYLYICVCM
ncbi:hypothetical protein EON65_25670 [archaeon]|nr:MAG: hypothetical protein EON65_25670 [archaeon]